MGNIEGARLLRGQCFTIHPNSYIRENKQRLERNKSKTGERKITILKIKNMTAKDFIEQTYWVKSRQSTFPLMNEVIAKTEEYGKEQWNASLHEIEQYVFNLYADRDNYSRGKLIEIITDKIEKLKK